MKKVRIIHPIPSFVCPRRYIEVGPLEAGQTIELPEEVANLIIRKKRAREIKIENHFLKWDKSGGL